MTTGRTGSVLRHLRSAVLRHDGGGLADGQLLEAFLARREEAAFGVLLRRHGPMVLGVCRRILRNGHDAEDAFQATFLVLARKAPTLLARETVGNWLYGVAYHTALKARAARTKRRAKEQQAGPPPGPAAPEDAWHDLRAVLDQELSRLPARYRDAVVLCDLEGKTRREVAGRLGLPEGTLSGRLTTARRMLAKRLARRGLGLSGGGLAALSPGASAACVPPPLIDSTVEAALLSATGRVLAPCAVTARAAALTEGVIRVMLPTNLKSATAMLLVAGAVLLGAGAVWIPVVPAKPADPAGPDKPAPAAPRADEPKAAALFSTRSIDFGGVSGDRPVGKSFSMRNPTAETYRLSGVRVADPAVAASPRSVELTPGDQGTIAVWVDPTRFRGPKTFRVWVHFSAPREEQVLLELKATQQSHENAPARSADARLLDLEKQLQRALEELRDLRKELRSRGPGDRR